VAHKNRQLRFAENYRREVQQSELGATVINYVVSLKKDCSLAN